MQTLKALRDAGTATLLLFLAPQICAAGVLVGTGMSSAMQGRVVPLVNGGYLTKSFGVTAMSTGVRTSAYYHNAYQLNVLLWNWEPGKFFWGPVKAGFGFGVYYARAGYKSGSDAHVDHHDDVAAGASMRVAWHLAGPVFLAIDSLFGLRNPFHPIALFFQEVPNVTLGINL